MTREGCWPIRDAGVLQHAFATRGHPQGWREEKEPARLFSKDPILNEALSKVESCLFYPLHKGFRLAFPYHRKAPFVLLPLFCFAKVRNLGGGEYLVFSFDEKGKPIY